MPSNVTVDNHLTLWISYNHTGGGRDWGINSITTTGTATVTWTRVFKSPGDFAKRCAVYIGRVTGSGSCTLIAAPTGGNTEMHGCCIEVSDLLSTTAVDVYAGYQNVSSFSETYSGVTNFSAQANNFVLAGIHCGPFVTALSITDPAEWTTEYTQVGATSQTLGMVVDAISTDIKQFMAVWDSTGNSGAGCACIVVFKGVDEGTPSVGEGPNVTAPQIMAFNTPFDEKEATSSFQTAVGPFIGPLIFNRQDAAAVYAETYCAVPCPVAGTFKNLVIHKISVADPGFLVYALRVNRSTSALSVRFTGTQTAQRNISRSVHVNAGDKVSLYVARGDVANASQDFKNTFLTVEFEPDTPNDNFYGWAMRDDTSLSTTATEWNGIFTGSPDADAAITSGDIAQSIIACPGSLKVLSVVLSVAPGVGKSRTFTMYRNGSIEASTAITISGTNTTGSVTLGSPIALSAGDRVWLEMVPIGTPAATKMSFGIKYTVTNLGQCQWTSCVLSVMGTTNARYEQLNGATVVGDAWNGVATRDGNQVYLPVTSPITFSGMEVRLSGAPGATKTYKFEIEKNDTTTSPTVDVTISDPNTTGNSASDSLDAVDGDYVWMKMTPTGTPTARFASYAVIVAAPTPDFNEDIAATMEGEGEIYEDESALQAAVDVEGPPGLTWIEWTDSNSVVHSHSNVTLPDPSSYPGYLKDNKVTDFGTVVRALSDDTGRYEGTDLTVRFADHEKLFRTLMDSTFMPNRAAVMRTISDKLRRQYATPRTIFRGLIRTYKPEAELGFSITFQDSFASKFSLQSGANQIPRRVITVTDFPAAPSGPTFVTKTFTTPVVAGPPGYVQLSDQAGARNLVGDISNGVYAPDVVRGWWGYNADGSEKIQGSQWYLVPGDVYWATPDVAEALEEASGGTSELTSVGLAVPIIYGKISDVNVAFGGGQGQVSPVYVGVENINGSDYHAFCVCGHAVKRITGVYVNDGKSGAGTSPSSAVGDLAGTGAAGSGGPWLVPGYDNWTAVFGGSADPFEDRNGNRYTIIYGLVGDRNADIAAGFYDTLTPESVRISLSLEGIEDIGDGTGSLINNLHLQYLHACQNWFFGNYLSGAWLASPTFPDDPTLLMIDEDSFRNAANLINYTGAFVLGNSVKNGESEFTTVPEVTARFNVSGSVDSGWNRKGQYFIDWLNVASPTVLGEHSDEDHILKNSFDITEDQAHHFNVIPFRHTKDYCGREKDGWLSVRTGVVELRDATSITNYSPVGFEVPLQAPIQELHMIRGKNTNADLDDYQDGTDTADDVLDRFLLFHTNPPRFVNHTMGHDGNNYDLAQIVRIRHYAGSGASGWTDRRCRIVRHEASPGKYTVDFRLQDLERIL